MEKVISELKIVEEPKQPISMNPKKFAMWLFIGSVIMLFAAFTSGYIVRRAEGNWVYFDLPEIFFYNTIVILISSLTLYFAYRAAKKDNLDLVKIWVSITATLGVLFLVGQLRGWDIMANNGIHFVGNPSGSFVIAITFVHVLHMVSAILVLLILLVSVFRYEVHSKNLLQIELCSTYWHFLGGLWLYLFVFLLLYR